MAANETDDTTMSIRMTKDERQEIQAAAEADGFRITSEWVRVQLKAAVKRASAPAPANAGATP